MQDDIPEVENLRFASTGNLEALDDELDSTSPVEETGLMNRSQLPQAWQKKELPLSRKQTSRCVQNMKSEASRAHLLFTTMLSLHMSCSISSANSPKLLHRIQNSR